MQVPTLLVKKKNYFHNNETKNVSLLSHETWKLKNIKKSSKIPTSGRGEKPSTPVDGRSQKFQGGTHSNLFPEFGWKNSECFISKIK